MPIKIYVAEDQPDYANKIVQAINNYILFSSMEMSIDFVTGNGRELLQNIDRNNQYNVYFLDINLVEDAQFQNGFTVAKEIRSFDPFGFIIFITIYSEMSFLTFQYRVQALDFIIKNAFINIDERIQSCLATVENRFNLLRKSHTILLSTDNGNQIFLMNDIVYFSANTGHVLSLSTQEKEFFIYNETLNKLENKLDDSFIRCHRSFIVNIEKISFVSKDYRNLKLSDGSQIPISVRNRTKLKKRLLIEIQSSAVIKK